MKLLIEIPEEKYNYFISNRNSYKRSIAESIINGQRLPDDCEVLTKEAYVDLCLRASKGQELNCSEIPKSSPTETLVSLGVYNQVACERNIAIQQLHELGYEFGQKIEPTTKNDLGVDAVSRKDVHDMLENLPVTVENKWFNWLQKACMRLAELPSVTLQEPRWIPVSEKLPEPFTFVNATCRSLIDDRKDWVIETLYLPIPKKTNKYGYSDWGNIPMLNCGDAEVIAWVERIIPEPYKAGK